MIRFIGFVNQRTGKNFSNYSELYRWSIEDIPDFWQAIRDFFPLNFYQEADEVMVPGAEMKSTRWFTGAQLNFAENLLTAYNLDHGYDDKVALLEINELGKERKTTYGELMVEVGRWAQALRERGIVPGDRVVGYLPNIGVTVIAMLATASLGAIWSSCSPDFGETGVCDRFRQVNPTLIIATDGYTYKGKPIPTFSNLRKLIADLLTDSPHPPQPFYKDKAEVGGGDLSENLRGVVVVPYLRDQGFSVEIPDLAGGLQVTQEEFLQSQEGRGIEFTPMPFSSPLYILYSSGTTGIPKCIMHGSGHTLIQHVKELGLHTDLKAEDVIFFHTTCGWMMWNWLVSSLFFKATVVLYEGNPLYPRSDYLLEQTRRHEFTIFGAGARYYQGLEQALKSEGAKGDDTVQVKSLKAVLSTGSPLSDHSYRFIYRELNDDIQLSSISGGTDIVSCFVLGAPILPVYAGEIQCRGLGMAVEVFDSEGRSVIEKKGEMVCTRPFPSMPIGFYNDPDGKKYHKAYFDSVPGIWCHGDYAEITSNDGVIIYGRSDTTLNPGGVRIGTAEIYRVVESFHQVAESAAVGWEDEEDSKVVLMLKLQPKIDWGRGERAGFFAELRKAIRVQISPRHIPAVIMIVPDIPRTVSGKISEKTITDLINGQEAENTGALANPECLSFYRGLVIAES